MRYYRWDTEKREDLSKEAEDKVVVPGTPAVLLLWRQGRYNRCGAILPLVSPQWYYGWVVRYYRWAPDRTRKSGEISTKEWTSSEGEKLMCTC